MSEEGSDDVIYGMIFCNKFDHQMVKTSLAESNPLEQIYNLLCYLNKECICTPGVLIHMI